MHLYFSLAARRFAVVDVLNAARGVHIGVFLFVLVSVWVLRIGTHFPVPCVDPAAVAAMFEQTRGSIVDIFNMFSGGALARLSVLALGVMPYISASIIIQMRSSIIPKLEQLKKRG